MFRYFAKTQSHSLKITRNSENFLTSKKIRIDVNNLIF